MTAELALATNFGATPLDARARGVRRALRSFAREVAENLDTLAKSASMDTIDLAYDVIRGLGIAQAHLDASHEIDAVISTETTRGRVVLLPQRYTSVVTILPSADIVTTALSVMAPALLGGSPVLIPDDFTDALVTLLHDAFQRELPKGSVARGSGPEGALVSGVLSPEESVAWATRAREHGQAYRVHEDTGAVAIILDASGLRRAARQIIWSARRANGNGLMRVRRIIVLSAVEAKLREALVAAEKEATEGAASMKNPESDPAGLGIEAARDVAEAVALAGAGRERSFACVFARHFDRALEVLSVLHHPRGAVGSTEPPIGLGGVEFPRGDALPGLPFGEPRIIVDGRPSTPLLAFPYSARTRSLAGHHLAWLGGGPFIARMRAGALGLYEAVRRRMELS